MDELYWKEVNVVELRKRLEKDYTAFLKSEFLLSKSHMKENVQIQFNKIYILKYLSGRIENKGFFDSDYYKITHSCLMEAFLLYSQNYLRAASLVLRSAIENYLKHYLKIYDVKVHARVYIENKNNLDTYLQGNIELPNKKTSLLVLNNKLMTLYKNLSGLSHSLTNESKNMSVNFTNDIHILSDKNLSIVHKYFNDTLDIMITMDIILSNSFLKYWSKGELNTLFRIVAGNKKTDRIIKIIKDEKDLLFHF